MISPTTLSLSGASNSPSSLQPNSTPTKKIDASSWLKSDVELWLKKVLNELFPDDHAAVEKNLDIMKERYGCRNGGDLRDLKLDDLTEYCEMELIPAKCISKAIQTQLFLSEAANNTQLYITTTTSLVFCFDRNENKIVMLNQSNFFYLWFVIVRAEIDRDRIFLDRKIILKYRFLAKVLGEGNACFTECI